MTDAWKVDKRKQGKTQGEHLGRLCDNLEKKWWLGSGEAVEVAKRGQSLTVCPNRLIGFAVGC